MNAYRYTTLNKIPSKGLDQMDRICEYTEHICDAQAAFVRSFDMHGLQLPADFLTVARVGVGVNNLPLTEMTEQGVVAFNTPGGNANAVKEMVFCALIAALRNYPQSVAWANGLSGDVRAAMEAGKDQFVGHEVKDKVLGVIGMGNVGSNVANLGMEYDMRVIGYDPYIATRSALHLRPEVKVTDNLNDVIAAADVLTLHVPATEENEKLLDRETIASLKDGVIVINYSRDKVVDEEAMVEALESGHVAFYLTDFVNDTILHRPGVIVSPHVGGSTHESEDNCALMAANQMVDYLENGNITNSVNYPQLHMGPRSTCTRIVLLGKDPDVLSRAAIDYLQKGGCRIHAMKSAGTKGTNERYIAAAFAADVDGEIEEMQLAALPGVIRARVL